MDYDVLLSHHSADKHLIQELHRRLQAQDLRVRLDAMDLPGMSWPQRLAAGTLDAPAVLVCIGGSGSWDSEQLRAALTLAKREQCLVIPVLLPGAPQRPEMSLFHMSRTWVDLSQGVYPAGVGRLVWGITGSRPGGGWSAPDPRFQLPADLPDFTGRSADRDWAVQCLTAGRSVAICALAGQGGLGKTALAVHAAHRLKDRFADGQVLIPLGGAGEGPLTAVDAMAWVIRAFAPGRRLPGDAAQVQAIYRDVLSGRRVLILADDAAGVEQVAPLIPDLPAAMILTSRRRIALGEQRDLDPLAPAAASALLAGILGEGRADAAADLDRLAAACDRLPLALRVAGSHLATHPQVPLDEYLAEIEGEVTRLAVLPSDAPVRGRVGAVLTLAADRLLAENVSLAARWQSLACFPAPFDRVAAAAVWGLTGPKAAQASLSDLIDRSLLRWDGNTRRYRLHDLLWPIAAAPWYWCPTAIPTVAPGPSPENLAVARGRHSAHFLAVLRAADQRFLQGHDGGTAGLAAYDADAGQIAAGQAWAAAEQAESATRLAMDYPDAGADVLGLRLHPRERLRWLESGLIAARRLGERRWEGTHLGNLGVAWAQFGEPRKAIDFYEQQLVITREIGDRRGEGAALGHLGGVLADLGELRKAIGCYGQRLVIAREIGDRRGEATTCENYGQVLERLGDRPGARFWMHAARGIYELIESPGGEDIRRWLAEHPWTPGVAPDAQPTEPPDRNNP
ncbi:TIR domain-containing protein [uncultured Thiodictyon sp.]|uniref:TIR domain-containing protein n=1 Tax=uncultured Thiodictyon sp. TaxID=1846217 RepID=UPI0025D9B488|nr:TIR domain-containing protein [uncultured Thiodictyon sp.]